MASQLKEELSHQRDDTRQNPTAMHIIVKVTYCNMVEPKGVEMVQ